MTNDMIHDVLKAERARYEGPARQGSCIQSKEAKRRRDGRGEDGRDLEGERRRRTESTTTSISFLWPWQRGWDIRAVLVKSDREVE